MVPLFFLIGIAAATHSRRLTQRRPGQDRRDEQPRAHPQAARDALHKEDYPGIEQHGGRTQPRRPKMEEKLDDAVGFVQEKGPKLGKMHESCGFGARVKMVSERRHRWIVLR